MISNAYEFMCDHCGNTAYYIYPSKKEAINQAGVDGWIKKKKLVFCCTSCYMKWFYEKNHVNIEKIGGTR